MKGAVKIFKQVTNFVDLDNYWRRRLQPTTLMGGVALRYQVKAPKREAMHNFIKVYCTSAKRMQKPKL
jgi:hypothetical protein